MKSSTKFISYALITILSLSIIPATYTEPSSMLFGGFAALFAGIAHYEQSLPTQHTSLFVLYTCFLNISLSSGLAMGIFFKQEQSVAGIGLGIASLVYGSSLIRPSLPYPHATCFCIYALAVISAVFYMEQEKTKAEPART